MLPPPLPPSQFSKLFRHVGVAVKAIFKVTHVLFGDNGRYSPDQPDPVKGNSGIGKEIMKRKNLTHDVKLEIVKLVESGQSKSFVGAKFGINESTVRGIYQK